MFYWLHERNYKPSVWTSDAIRTSDDVKTTTAHEEEQTIRPNNMIIASDRILGELRELEEMKTE